MKKILLSLLIILLSIFSLSSCVGVQNDPTGPNGGNNDQNQDDNPSGDNDNDGLVTYTVQLYRNGNIWIPNIEIYAIFVNDNSVTEVLIDDFYGIATFRGDGEYNVHLSACPRGYTYNPNDCVVDLQHTELIIDLYRLTDYDHGNGSSPFGDNAYYISKTGYYSVDINSPDDELYFQFLPVQSGSYEIESICDIYEDAVDPIAIKYEGTSSYIHSPTTIDDGGTNLDSGYTTNFKFTFDLDAATLNQARVFSIKAESRYEEYPVTVYFSVTYIGSYQMGDPFDPQVIAPEEASSAVTPISTGSFHYFSEDGKLDVSKVGYNSETGFWCLLNEDGSLGATLCAQIINDIPCLGLSFRGVYESGNAGSVFYLMPYDENDVRLCYNYFLFGDGPLLDSDNNPLVYTGNYYSQYANSEGFVYVTNEIMLFLQRMSEHQNYFNDGAGWAETYGGISSGQDDQWLFACGYYE